VPSPDVIVAIAGCYYEYQGAPVDLLDEVDGETVVVPDDPAGERTVEVILDAIRARKDQM
jgi:hypothetical protein